MWRNLKNPANHHSFIGKHSLMNLLNLKAKKGQAIDKGRDIRRERGEKILEPVDRYFHKKKICVHE